MILPISHGLLLCEPFTDYLNITTPKGNGELLLRSIQPFLDALGMSEVSEGLYMLPEKGGSFKIHPRGKVDILGASGGFLEALRRSGSFNHYLAEFSNFEHRISMMHATADYRIDAPPVIEAVYQLGRSGTLNLTRKAVDPSKVFKVNSPGRDGRDTGTVYLGDRKNADVWAKVYDKGQERFAKQSVEVGQIVRVEIAVQSDVGATLRDASLPHDIYFHFASRSLVEAPPDFKGWEPHGSGFCLSDEKPDLTGIQRLKGILDNSFDVSRLIKVAREEYGEQACDVLVGLIKKRCAMSSTI